MRKIFLLTAAILLAIGDAAIAQANQNLGRISDLYANEFVYRMSESKFHSESMHMGMDITFTPPVRRVDLDDPQNFPNMRAVTVNYGVADSTTFDGEICFFLDSEFHISAIKLTNIADADVSGVVLFMTLEVLGLSRSEIAELIKNDAPDDEVWCAAANRKICRKFADPAGNERLLFSTRN